MSDRVGYEKDHVIYEAVHGWKPREEYWCYRLKNGRRVEAFGPFKNEKALDREIERLRAAPPTE